jgi:hypothetical protein
MNPNCHDCRWRGELPGDAHSCCNHPYLSQGNESMKWIAAQTFFLSGHFEPLNVTADPHGIRKGWFLWPLNFDPVWLQSCNGFTAKEVKKPDEEKQPK